MTDWMLVWHLSVAFWSVFPVLVAALALYASIVHAVREWKRYMK